MTRRANNGIKAHDRRNHRRVPMTIPVSMELGKAGGSVTVQNYDISWGGIRFAVARDTVAASESVTVRFPWADGSHFSANAEVLRTEPLDQDQDLVAARFSSLTTADQRRLEKLLIMLQDSDDPRSDESAPLAPVLELLFSDPDEMREKLAELAQGHLSITVFETYEVNQSLRLVLGGVTDQPALRLRARVAEVQALTGAAGSTFPISEVQLRFEHPLHELQAAAAALLERLAEEPELFEVPLDSTFCMMDGEYL